jgi:hypothetical protein
MLRLAILAGATLLSIACTDDPQKAATPTAPEAPAFSKASVPPPRRTTLCLSYLRKRARLEVRLAESPNDSTLRKESASYARVLADACRRQTLN